MTAAVIVAVAVVLFVGGAAVVGIRQARNMTPEERAEFLAARQAQREARRAIGPRPNPRSISVAGDTSSGTLACPKCKGTQFKARRSGKARAGIAVTTVATGGIGGLGAAAVTRRRQVQCVTCGTKYLRG